MGQRFFPFDSPTNLNRDQYATDDTDELFESEYIDRDDGDEAVGRQNGHLEADEKFNEDGATASFSETTLEDDEGGLTAVGEHQ